MSGSGKAGLRTIVPVGGLRVEKPWRVGLVTFHPGADRDSILLPGALLSEVEMPYSEHIEQVLSEAENGCVAIVHGVQDIEDVLTRVRASLDALRLFQLARRLTMTPAFGLPGDVYRSPIRYIVVGDRTRPGGIFRGDAEGWTFDEDAQADWERSPGFGFLNEALAAPDASEGARRAVLGTRLFARAALDHETDLKMLGLVAALEAWVVNRSRGPQTMLLARHVSWFGCGVQEGDLCGRGRPICPYLRLVPGHKKDRERLVELRKLGNTFFAWRCSEWHRVMDWYDRRSGAAHGDPSVADSAAASEAEFWIAHFLAEPIFEWLGSHRDDPVGALQAWLDEISEPSDWQQMLNALDSDDPPSVPPITSV